MKSIFEKDFFTWENLKTTWEVRLVVFTVRALFAFGVFLLILSFGYRAWQWGEMQWVRKDPLSRLEPLIAESVARGTPQDVTKWLRFRSAEDSAVILDTVPAYAASLDSFTFFNLAARSEYMGNQDDAIFWFFYGRYRLRYDLLRCGSPDSIKVMALLQSFSDIGDPSEDFTGDAEKMVPVLRRVLDHDAKFPPENNPAYLCKAVNKLQRGSYAMVDKSQWAAIRHLLRVKTEQAIEDMTSKKGDAPEKGGGQE